MYMYFRYNELVYRQFVNALLTARKGELALKVMKKVATDIRWSGDAHGQLWSGWVKEYEDRGAQTDLSSRIKNVAAGASYVVTDNSNIAEPPAWPEEPDASIGTPSQR